MFVVIEGIDGCGKSTLARRIKDSLEAGGRPVRHLREPGGTPLGERLRDLLLAPDVAIAPPTEALLYSAARAELVAAVIRPALDRGEHVLCERYFYSTLAYQGAGLHLDAAALEAVSRLATGGLLPDRVLLLDVEPGVALRRLAAARDRIESRDADYFRRVREAFLAIARGQPSRFTVIDAAQDRDAVHSAACRALADAVP